MMVGGGDIVGDIAQPIVAVFVAEGAAQHQEQFVGRVPVRRNRRVVRHPQQADVRAGQRPLPRRQPDAGRQFRPRPAIHRAVDRLRQPAAQRFRHQPAGRLPGNVGQARGRFLRGFVRRCRRGGQQPVHPVEQPVQIGGSLARQFLEPASAQSFEGRDAPAAVGAIGEVRRHQQRLARPLLSAGIADQKMVVRMMMGERHARPFMLCPSCCASDGRAPGAAVS